jgi:hypothetical protein
MIKWRMRWAGHVACMREMRIAYVGKPERRRPLGRHRHRWEDNIKMNLREIGWEVVDWMDLTQDRHHVAGSYEHGNEPSGSITGGGFLE